MSTTSNLAVAPSSNGNRISRVALLTSGGDAPGMNAAIRAVVRTAAASDVEVVGYQRGFEGLVADAAEVMAGRAVANIIQRGGTVLGTSRSQAIRTVEGRAIAIENMRRRQVDALIVIGGEGSTRAAIDLVNESGIPAYVIPATIDNDLAGSDWSIGFDTAVNTGIEAIDRIRDTAFSFERVFCVEVMGRDSGFIALAVAIGAGAEAVVVPEIPKNVGEICDRIEQSHRRGKKSSIIVVSEGPRTGGVMPIADALSARLGTQARIVVLGHIQRGGAPSARDRLLASRMGYGAVHAAMDRAPGCMIAENRGEITRMPLSSHSKERRTLEAEMLELVHVLAS
jgi:6-phosphofructokinase 1